MKERPFLTIILLLCFCPLSGCKKKPVEKFSAEEVAAAAKLKAARDPIQEEIYAFRLKTRQAYNSRRFDELETKARELRVAKPVFGNGSWKIAQFYESFECRSDEPESMWQLHDRIHRDWIAAKPDSITARVAYADFLVDSAWHARGSGFADTVTETGWRLFRERLASARAVLGEARRLPEKDPVWWLVALLVARGESWTKPEYNALFREAKRFEPEFWGYDTEHAIALLPRWLGEAGDWEAYAWQASARPDGLGDETYARIVTYLRAYYDKNIFRESKASWPKTRAGLKRMREKYPDSLEIASATALLAAMAQDRGLAKETFDRLGDTYLPGIWGKPERFIHYRNWAESRQISSSK